MIGLKSLLGFFASLLSGLAKVYSKKPIKEKEVYRDAEKRQDDSPFTDSDW